MDSIDAAAAPFEDGASGDHRDDHERDRAAPYALVLERATDKCSRTRANSRETAVLVSSADGPDSSESPAIARDSGGGRTRT